MRKSGLTSRPHFLTSLLRPFAPLVSKPIYCKPFVFLVKQQWRTGWIANSKKKRFIGKMIQVRIWMRVQSYFDSD